MAFKNKPYYSNQEQEQKYAFIRRLVMLVAAMIGIPLLIFSIAFIYLGSQMMSHLEGQQAKIQKKQTDFMTSFEKEFDQDKKQFYEDLAKRDKEFDDFNKQFKKEWDEEEKYQKKRTDDFNRDVKAFKENWNKEWDRQTKRFDDFDDFDHFFDSRSPAKKENGKKPRLEKTN